MTQFFSIRRVRVFENPWHRGSAQSSDGCVLNDARSSIRSMPILEGGQKAQNRTRRNGKTLMDASISRAQFDSLRALCTTTARASNGQRLSGPIKPTTSAGVASRMVRSPSLHDRDESSLMRSASSRSKNGYRSRACKTNGNIASADACGCSKLTSMPPRSFTPP